MATQPAFLRKNEAPAGPQQGVDAANRTSRMRAVRDPFQLRALPHEHLFLFNKKIDNTRLVREADPKSRGACWSAIGAACWMSTADWTCSKQNCSAPRDWINLRAKTTW